MKKLFLVVFLLLFVAAVNCFAADAVITTSSITTYTIPNYGGNNIIGKVVTFTWTDKSAADGTAFTTSFDKKELYGWCIYSVETNPGTTAPTDNYDITMLSEGGIDVLGSQTLNRDEANTEIANIGLQTNGYPVITGALTLTIANNSVNSATGTIKVVFLLPN